MIFHFGAVPEDPDFMPEQEGWTALREPSPWVTQLCAAPVAAAAGFGTVCLWAVLTEVSAEWPYPDWWLVPLFLGLVLLHEMLHALLHPRLATTPDSILGFWPSKVLFYAHYQGTWSKWAFVRCGLGPFFVLSVLPPVICALVGYPSPTLLLLSVVNALASCVDLLGAMFIMWQVPSGGIVRNKGWYTYYRV
ncbi:MAG: DUF3267 domain-containing protein [Thermodesulfobacteriota bacterium]